MDTGRHAMACVGDCTFKVAARSVFFSCARFSGFANYKISEFSMELGGWLDLGLTRNLLDNRPKIALNQY